MRFEYHASQFTTQHTEEEKAQLLGEINKIQENLNPDKEEK